MRIVKNALLLVAAGLLVAGPGPAAAQDKPRPAAARQKAKPAPASRQASVPKAPAVAAGAAGAAAAAGAAGAAGGERFDDWRLGCERPANAPKATCFIEQRLSHKDSPERLALAMAIGYFAPESKPAMIIKLPPVAIQDAGVIMQVDQRPIREVGIRTCGPDNCSVMAAVDDDLLAEMRGGKEVVIAYSRKETDEIIRVPVSLRGLTRGLAELRKR
ncbi:hypothetical protein STVA_45200 [Allostella vacuolata]|nr:hypothetical protein STVA_45200 [Stella vacuolata]